NQNWGFRPIKKELARQGYHASRRDILSIMKDIRSDTFGLFGLPLALPGLPSSTEARIRQELLAHPNDTFTAIWRKLRAEGLPVGKTSIYHRKKDFDAERAQLAGTTPPPPRDRLPIDRRYLGAATEARIRQEFHAHPTDNASAILRKLRAEGLQVSQHTVYKIKAALDAEQAKLTGTVPPPLGASLDAGTEARIQQEFHAHPTDAAFAIWRKLKAEGHKVGRFAISMRKAAFDAAQAIPVPNPAPSTSQQGPSSSQPAPASAAVGGAGAPHSNIAWAANYIRQPGNWGQHGGQWARRAGDLVMPALAQALRRNIEIHRSDTGEAFTVEPADRDPRFAGNPIRVFYNGHDHYDAWVNGQRQTIAGQGDCLFEAVLAGMDPEARARSTVQLLREAVAQELETHSQRYEESMMYRSL
ncbi:OTU domain-containing protein, partial [Brucella intermedia]|uniref:OTU domain-containing protein n=1 Tax=Brucella intermedia TaxID=94625 RepID=UPI002362D7CB